MCPASTVASAALNAQMTTIQNGDKTHIDSAKMKGAYVTMTFPV